MSIKTIHHCNIRAPAEELKRLRDFYCTVLGFEEGPRPPFRSAGYWLYAGGKPILHLSEMRNGDTLVEVSQRQAAFGHIAFRCTDLRTTLERLKQNGVKFFVEDVPLVNQKQIFFEDPSGIGVELNFPMPSVPKDTDVGREARCR
jgi:glyoxylase I family protein